MTTFAAIAVKHATTPRSKARRRAFLTPPTQFVLTTTQARVYASPARFRVDIAGRRSGKTWEGAIELVSNAMRGQTVNWYVAPTYKQAKLIMWDTLKRIVPVRYLATKPNDSDLEMRFISGSLVSLKGADKPDSLRGPGIDFAVLDEFAFIDPEAWYEVVRPMLSRGSQGTPGRALFKTTPRGFNWAYDLYLKGKEGHADWESFTCTTSEGALVPQDEIDAARRDLDPRTFRQEYEASFEHLAGRVYESFRRDDFPIGNLDADVHDTGGELLVGMDFNVNPMSAVVAVAAGDTCLVLDALEVMTSNTEEMCTELRRRYGDRRIVVCPDPSAKARKTSAPIGTTDLTILQRHGFILAVDSRAPLIVDRVNNTNALLCASDGTRRVRIHPRAKKLIRALDGLTYKDGTSLPDKALGLDHIADAFDYLTWQRFNLLAKRKVRVGALTI